MDDETLVKVVQDISEKHQKIIDDWCKSYLAQRYQETGIVPKPGDFILNQQSYALNEMKAGYKYWFTHKDE